MTRKLTRHPSPDGVNPMRHWQRHINPWRASWNFFIIYLAKYTPWTGAKNAMYRSLGMRVGKNSAVGLGAVFDVFFPGLITVGDNSIIGYNSTILAHEFLVNEWRTGEVAISQNVLIGANATILAGVTIGDGATIGAGSVVTGDVPPGEFYAGAPARPIPRSSDR